MRILCAEDDRDLNAAVKALLTRSGYQVDTVFNGEDALSYARAEQYDGIILDWMMPVMDGLEALKTMRAEGFNAPCLLLTARDAVGDRVAAMAVAEARRLRPRGRRLEGLRPEEAALVGGLLQIKVAHAKGSNRARSAGGWGQPDPVARRHGRALEHVRRLAVVDDDARAVGVARQGDVLRQQAMVVHELELEV